MQPGIVTRAPRPRRFAGAPVATAQCATTSDAPRRLHARITRRRCCRRLHTCACLSALDLSQPESAADTAEWPPIDAVPPKVWTLTSLEVLSLKKNLLTELPADVGNLSNLRELDVSENKLSALPTEIGQLAKLRKFDASENEITELPTSIGNLKELTTLIFFKNLLRQLPAEIGGCVSLEEVNFFNNKLIKVPAQLGDLENLDDLNVAGNKLKTLCKTDKWTKLKRLAIMWNTMVMLPSFAPMANLEQLQMNNNMLSSFPAMGNMSKLTLLDANSNPHLEGLPEETELRAMTSLTNVNCRGCSISMVPAAIGDLKALETLNLGKNKLSELPSQLGGCSGLKVLFVDSNALTGLPATLGGCGSLTRINVMDNPLDMSDADQAALIEKLNTITAAQGGWVKGV